MKAGLLQADKVNDKVLLPSPRNPIATNISLMEQTQSSHIVHSKELTPLVDGICAAKTDLKRMAINSLDELLEAQTETFPFNLTFDQAVDQPIVVLHSSGSTGLPKPVTMTHGTFAVLDNDRNFPSVPGRKNHDFTVWDFDTPDARIYEPFPPFHLAGFTNKIVVPLYTHTIPVSGPPLRPPSGALVKEIMQQQDLCGCYLPPAVAEQILHEPNGLDYFKTLDVFAYAGGPLSQAAGDEISKVTMVCQFYGSTEVGNVRQLVPLREDWSYMEFHPYAKLDLQPAEDDAFELVIYADASVAGSTALYHNLPGVTEYRTKDLFRPHPSKKNLWRFHGRRDDIIVLSNGEKFNPVPMESTLQAHPSIAGVVVTGQGRFLPALLVEPKPDDRNKNILLQEIWPLVESANLNAPGHGRILQSMIIIAEPNKPFVRAGKGTVIRKLTEAAYANEIAALYVSHPQQQPSAVPSSLEASAFRRGAVTSFVRSTLAQSMPGIEFLDEDNFYSFGLDSLKTAEAVINLKASLVNHRKASELSWLSADTLYRYPSVNELSSVILAFLNEDIIPGERERVAEMNALFETFTKSFKPPGLVPSTKPVIDGIVVALTGSTGSLGSYLLYSLSIDPVISHIYCLDRSTAARQRWEEFSGRRDTAETRGQAKVTFLTTNLARPQFGLVEGDFARITNHCDLIIHNAWKVDFNQSLHSFTDNIQSVRTLAEWSASSPRQPRIVFISSISSVGAWKPTHKHGSTIPEAPIADFSAALHMGYAESKQVAERILDVAATECGVPVTILRVGQICGSTITSDVPWAEKDALPSMLATSTSLGLIPSDLHPVDWIPIDKISRIILELSLHDLEGGNSTPTYYNLVNPQPVAWSQLLEPLRDYCGPTTKAVPLAEWVRKLQTFDKTDAAQLEAKPALKTLKFFVAMASSGSPATYQTKASVQASESMAALNPINPAWLQSWFPQRI